MANQYSADVPKGFNVPKQVRLDSITGVQNEETLKDLGDGNNLAFKYYDSIKIHCKDEKTEYIWREVIGLETGLLDTAFTYPTYPPVDGIDYSGKTYNFFQIPNNIEPADGSETKLIEGTNVTITGTGTILDPYEISSSFETSQTYIEEGDNITITGTGILSDPFIINTDLTDLGIIKTIDNEIITPGQTLSIINNELTGKVLVTKEYVQSVIPSVPNGSETKINSGSNITITGIGTIVSPYIINGQYSPFEKIDEGNSFGYIIRGRDAANFGNIGWDAIDFSTNSVPSVLHGATGTQSFAVGDNVIAGGYASVVFGYKIINNGVGSFDAGFNLKDTGYINTLFGAGHEVSTIGVTVVGQASNIISTQILDMNATLDKPLFVVGNGTIQNDDPEYTVLTRSDAFIVRMNGLATLPSVTNDLILADTTGKAIVTKEYLNLQKIITYPADFTGTNYTITNADNNYIIIVDNVTTAVTITVPTGLTSKIGIGFIQKGTADITFVASGTIIQNPIGLKLKGQYYQTFIEQELATNTFYLLGNTKI